MLRPVREALGWTLSSHVALVKDNTPADDLPSPRLVDAELVEPGRVPADLAARVDRVRDLTAPPDEDEDAPPPSSRLPKGSSPASLRPLTWGGSWRRRWGCRAAKASVAGDKG